MQNIRDIDIIKDGEPLTITYGRNLEKSPYLGSEYAQDIEPSGEYMIIVKPEWRLKNVSKYEYGEITFNNPFIIEFETTKHGGWKTKLSERYKGKKNKKLSNAIIKDGYDAIVTVDSEMGNFVEIVNLKGIKTPWMIKK